MPVLEFLNQSEVSDYPFQSVSTAYVTDVGRGFILDAFIRLGRPGLASYSDPCSLVSILSTGGSYLVSFRWGSLKFMATVPLTAAYGDVLDIWPVSAVDPVSGVETALPSADRPAYGQGFLQVGGIPANPAVNLGLSCRLVPGRYAIGYAKLTSVRLANIVRSDPPACGGTGVREALALAQSSPSGSQTFVSLPSQGAAVPLYASDQVQWVMGDTGRVTITDDLVVAGGAYTRVSSFPADNSLQITVQASPEYGESLPCDLRDKLQTLTGQLPGLKCTDALYTFNGAAPDQGTGALTLRGGPGVTVTRDDDHTLVVTIAAAYSPTPIVDPCVSLSTGGSGTNPTSGTTTGGSDTNPTEGTTTGGSGTPGGTTTGGSGTPGGTTTGGAGTTGGVDTTGGGGGGGSSDPGGSSGGSSTGSVGSSGSSSSSSCKSCIPAGGECWFKQGGTLRACLYYPDGLSRFGHEIFPPDSYTADGCGSGVHGTPGNSCLLTWAVGDHCTPLAWTTPPERLNLVPGFTNMYWGLVAQYVPEEDYWKLNLNFYVWHEEDGVGYWDIFDSDVVHYLRNRWSDVLPKCSAACDNEAGAVAPLTGITWVFGVEICNGQYA